MKIILKVEKFLKRGRLVLGLVLALIFIIVFIWIACIIIQNCKDNTHVEDSKNLFWYKRKPIKNSLRQLTPNSAHHRRKKSIVGKTILFWTGFWGAHSLHGWNITSSTLDKCPVQCKFTVDRRHYLESDVVVFQLNSIYHNLSYPVIRGPDQIWVLFRIEPPNFYDLDMVPYNHIFNWTMTYRKDSDIPCPYGSFERLENESVFAQFVALQPRKTKKSKLIAWAVSHCHTDSRREEMVKSLNSFIPVDIFGACGTLNCTQKKTHMWKTDGSCYEEIAADYKFYLSLEHTLCQDYVTEKFFMALDYDIVPIVYGGANYAQIAPPKSYISVEDFPTIEKLAEYLMFLDGNEAEYEAYFEWKKTFRVSRDLSKRWCHLCRKVWDLDVKIDERSEQVYENVDTWWRFGKDKKREQGVCRTPREKWS